jgi:uncharacterized protein (DUF4415 family)
MSEFTTFFHIEPTRHDLKTLNTLKCSFDVVAELAPDGDGWYFYTN